jgi:hypothetical protein
MSTREFETCVVCGAKSPNTETNYTLISPKFGWRLSRRPAGDGTFIVEWRCADCWSKHKEKQAESTRRPKERTATGPQAPADPATTTMVPRRNPGTR